MKNTKTSTVTAGIGLAAAVVLGPQLLNPNAASAQSDEPPSELQLTGVLRDFRAAEEPDGHPDFEVVAGQLRVGLVETHLDVEGKPAVRSFKGQRVEENYTDAQGRPINPALYDPDLGDVAGELETPLTKFIHSTNSFHSWFRDVLGVNLSVPLTITLQRDPATGTYVFDDQDFFPLNDQLFGNYTDNRNFHFTFELDTHFVHDADADLVFTFTGDDDVWVFIDGKLVIDLGGSHSARQQTIALDRLDLTGGETYGLKFFFTERHTSSSHLRIETTLQLESGPAPTISASFD